MDVPEGMNVNVVENTDNTVHVTLPAAPTGHTDLSDEELANAAGAWMPPLTVV
jgi:mersacidin/lichenicidin family type 2 lantibiotic